MRYFAIGICILCVFSSSALASNPEFKVAVHVLAHEARRSCTNLPQIAGPEDIMTTYPGCGEIDFFPVFFDLNEYKGVEYGVTWPCYYSCTLTTCSSLHIGEIVWPGDWIAQTWFICQPGPVAVPGWETLILNSPSRICLIQSANQPSVTVADCSEPSPNLEYCVANFCAGVCGATGDDPGATPINKATWGAIKQLFR